MATTSPTFVRGPPSTGPLYRVLLSEWLSETQIGDWGVALMPHGLMRLRSVDRATPGMSDTRFVWTYAVPAPVAGPTATTRSAAAAARTNDTRRDRVRWRTGSSSSC